MALQGSSWHISSMSHVLHGFLGSSWFYMALQQHVSCCHGLELACLMCYVSLFCLLMPLYTPLMGEFASQHWELNTRFELLHSCIIRELNTRFELLHSCISGVSPLVYLRTLYLHSPLSTRVSSLCISTYAPCSTARGSGNLGIAAVDEGEEWEEGGGVFGLSTRF